MACYFAWISIVIVSKNFMAHFGTNKIENAIFCLEISITISCIFLKTLLSNTHIKRVVCVRITLKKDVIFENPQSNYYVLNILTGQLFDKLFLANNFFLRSSILIVDQNLYILMWQYTYTCGCYHYFLYSLLRFSHH